MALYMDHISYSRIDDEGAIILCLPEGTSGINVGPEQLLTATVCMPQAATALTPLHKNQQLSVQLRSIGPCMFMPHAEHACFSTT